MSESETPKPRRRRKKAAAADAPEATSTSEGTAAPADEAARQPSEASADDETTRAATSSEPTAEQPAEIEPAPEDIEAEEAADDVVLEAEAEIDEDSEAEAEKPKPARRRRRTAAAKEPEAPVKPAPSRRRRERDPSLPIPVVRAQAKYVRSSPRKARLVCDHIRGKSVEDARAILAHTPRAIARDWSKLLESAVANAEHNHELVGEDLYVKAVHADDGPTIKRFRPRAMGRATKIRKRTSHLTILLTPKD
jgi:ribosomal protein L22